MSEWTNDPKTPRPDMRPEQVSTADLARQALQRLTTREDELRELLSYFEAQAQHSGYALEESAYTDAAGKLRAILDGEK